MGIVEVHTVQVTNEEGSVATYDAIAVSLLLVEELTTFLREKGVKPLGSWSQVFRDRHYQLFEAKELAEVKPLALEFAKRAGQ